MSINRNNKDRLFVFLFGRSENRAWTLDLYNAVNGSHYEDPDAIEINTIEDAVYMGMKNDVSFILYDEINLYAHQSTYNPNMPLRELIYLGKLYEKYIAQNKARVYGSRIVEVPVPKFVVFYNGTREAEDEVILELKDAFPAGIDPEASDVQVRVRMLNINYGRNRELLEACKPLMEYSWFVDRAREYSACEEYTLEQAVDKAVDEMPEEYRIKPVLIANRAEVKDMWLTEYDEEEVMQQFRDEGYEDGLEDGREEGLTEGREEGHADGVRAVVEISKDLGGSSLDAVEKIVANMGIPRNEADRLVSKYW